MTDRGAESCEICGGAMRSVEVSDRLSVTGCRGCGHRVGVHASTATQADYFAQYVYDREGFVASLRRTRVRQAERWLDLLRSCASDVDGVFDFGCGHGWFLQEMARAGLNSLVGADASQIAVDELRQVQIGAVLVASERPEELDPADLPFQPRVLTMLDVIEHFPPTRARALLSALRQKLAPKLELLLVKVPASSGLLHHCACLLSRLRVTAPLEQLWQVGTTPPHFSYFSRSSLTQLLSQAGFSVVGWERDCDFEPDGLADRIRVLRRLPRWAAHAIGGAVAATSKVARMEDAIICVARPHGR